MKLLQCAELPDFGPETKQLFNKIEKSRDPCQICAQKPRKLKFALRADKNFHHSFYSDVFYTEGKPVIHAVEEATSFHAAKCLIEFKPLLSGEPFACAG